MESVKFRTFAKNIEPLPLEETLWYRLQHDYTSDEIQRILTEIEKEKILEG
jgi:hypothetical protein